MSEILCLFTIGFSEPDSFIAAHVNMESIECYLRIQALQDDHSGYAQHIGSEGELYYHTIANPDDMIYIVRKIPIEDWVKLCPGY